MGLLFFTSTRLVIKAEQALGKEKLFYRVVPVPRRLSERCGLAIECAEKDQQKVEEILRQKGIAFFYE